MEGQAELEPGNAAGRILGHTHSVAEFARPDGSLPVTEEGLAFRRQLEAVYEDEDALTESFNAMVIRLMRERGVSVDKLCELTGLSLGTVKRLRKDPVRIFLVEEIVAFCIALQLPPRVSQMVVARSSAKFINSTDMRLYEYAMLNYYRQPVSWVNRWLLSAGAPPLTSFIDGYDEDGHSLVS